MDEGLRGIKKIANEVRKNVLERFSLGETRGYRQFPPEIMLTPRTSVHARDSPSDFVKIFDLVIVQGTLGAAEASVVVVVQDG